MQLTLQSVSAPTAHRESFSLNIASSLLTEGREVPMPESDYEVARMAAAAERLMTQTPEELEYSFRLAWAQSRESAALPHRGSDDFWRNARSRLARGIAEHSEVGSVTMVMIATSVLQWAEGVGVDPARFEGPLSIYVALVAKSVFDELRSRTDSKETEPKGDSKKSAE
jgi:hypothetical protein